MKARISCSEVLVIGRPDSRIGLYGLEPKTAHAQNRNVQAELSIPLVHTFYHALAHLWSVMLTIVKIHSLM